MSTIKSSAENLTLNADGANNDVIIQSNGSTKVTVDGTTGNVGIGDTDPSEAKLSITGVQAGDVGVKIVQEQDQYGIHIDHNGNNHGIFIDNASTTTGGVVVDSSALTTGNAGWFYSNSADTSTRKLFLIQNDHADSTGTTALTVQQDSTGLAADFNGTGGIRSAGGIKFGTDTAAANALNDYETGTWTPANQWITITNAVQARYVKIGNMVTVWGNITWASSPSDVSQTGGKIQGLPFTPLGGDHPFLGSWWTNATTGARKPDNYDFYVDSSTTLIIYNRTSSRVAQRQQVSSSHMKFQATYQVS